MLIKPYRPVAKQSGFHHTRLAKQASKTKLPVLPVETRLAKTPEDLWQAAQLRARSFFVYPAERAFAGKLHQAVKAKEEFAALQQRQSSYHSGYACLVALAAVPEHLVSSSDMLPDQAANDPITIVPGEEACIVGTLDLVLQAHLEGEVLWGRTKRPAYLANFCVADVARRRGVATAMLNDARQLVRSWDVDALFVHMMAANGGGRAFYEHEGFVLDQEESSNRAHFRGQCLDGVSGGARTILLQDTLLFPEG